MTDKMKKTPPPLPVDNRTKEKRKYPDISLDKVVEMVMEKCGNVSVERFGTKLKDKETDVLIILPMADKELKTMIHWGECHPINKYEQIYQGIGHYIMDGTRRIVIVSHFLYIYAAERSPVSAAIINEKYDSIMARIEYERDIYRKNERSSNNCANGKEYDPFVDPVGLSEPVLYGHTHPGLGCFFSPPDKTSGFATPDIPAVTFVADPIRREMKAGVGIDLKDAHILVFSYSDKIKGMNKRDGMFNKGIFRWRKNKV